MTDTLPVSSGRDTRRVVYTRLREHKLLTTGGLLALAGAAGASLLTAPLLGGIVDLAIAGDSAAITQRVLLLLVVAGVQATFAFAGLVAVARLGEMVLAALREDFVAHALVLPPDLIEDGGSGDLISRITEDVALISWAVRSAVPEFVQAVLILVLSLVGLTVLDWRFGLAALLAAPVQVWTVRWYRARSTVLYRDQRAAMGAEAQQLLESIGGAPTVRAFGLADQHVGLIRDTVERRVDLVVVGTRLHTRFFGRLNVAELIGLSAVLVTGFVLVRADAVTIGTAGAAALYVVSLFVPINRVLSLLDMLQSATASLARLVGIFEVTVDSGPADTGVRPRDGSVSVEGLRYAYVPGHDVLHGISLEVPAGGTIALVGGSGGGKSTLASLIAGTRTPLAGTVRIGGVPLVSLPADAVRRTVVLVTQEVHVFAGTLADDLRLAQPGASDRELADALEAVGALRWARALPGGLETVVGEGGVRLTAEQAQQLALARVLLADPAIVVLDEATAEAGSSGSRALDVAAARVLADRTGVVVAHRLSQAAQADVVLVMDGGRVIERGSHTDLVAAGGRYASLWKAWSDGR